MHIRVNLAIKLKLLFQFNKYIEYIAQPIAAPTIHKSPEVNLKFNSKSNLPLLIIVNYSYQTY